MVAPRISQRFGDDFRKPGLDYESKRELPARPMIDAFGDSISLEIRSPALKLGTASNRGGGVSPSHCETPGRKRRAMASKPRTSISETPRVGRKRPMAKINKTRAGARRGDVGRPGGAATRCLALTRGPTTI